MVREDRRDAEHHRTRAMTLRLRLVIGLLVLLTVVEITDTAAYRASLRSKIIGTPSGAAARTGRS